MRTIRASEIATYLFCQRAWWYQKQGQSSENLPDMAAGTWFHNQHSRSALSLGCLRLLAYIMMLLSLGLASFYLTRLFL